VLRRRDDQRESRERKKGSCLGSVRYESGATRDRAKSEGGEATWKGQREKDSWAIVRAERRKRDRGA
jgi:hypothetical protein